MTNYSSFVSRINKSQTLKDCEKLEKSLVRLYNNNCLTVSEFQRLDSKLTNKFIELSGD